MMDDLLQEMIDPTPQRGDTSRWRRFGATAAIFALAGLGITSLTTSALFTDRESTAGDLLTGTVDLSLGTFAFTMPIGRPGAGRRRRTADHGHQQRLARAALRRLLPGDRGRAPDRHSRDR